ncbi:MAG: hypothetical protein NVS9B4_19560 [Candidatus Acidiferrum sp.]
MKERPAARRANGKLHSLPELNCNSPLDFMQNLQPEELFLGMLCLERKRAERSGKKFLLVLVDAADILKAKDKNEVLRGLAQAMGSARRETDLAGWYKQDAVLGIIFTELGNLAEATAVKRVTTKVQHALAAHLKKEHLKNVRVAVHVFAENSNDDEDTHVPPNPTFYPDLSHRDGSRKLEFQIKRVMDVVGSVVALVLFSPIFLLIVVLIKLTSKGPVFFQQERIGQFGNPFKCLKFRSMHANNDATIHQNFMKLVIKGNFDGNAGNGKKPVYKMTHDPRITPVGRWLRKTSLDELPQFINVIRGEMALVGPRPPLAYEVEEYDIWHRRRIMEVKPGITGLWQVKGRSRVRFDDMVRLDLQYARGWSLWLDIRILLKTPAAVLMGDGAY